MSDRLLLFVSHAGEKPGKKIHLCIQNTLHIKRGVLERALWLFHSHSQSWYSTKICEILQCLNWQGKGLKNLSLIEINLYIISLQTMHIRKLDFLFVGHNSYKCFFYLCWHSRDIMLVSTLHYIQHGRFVVSSALVKLSKYHILLNL